MQDGDLVHYAIRTTASGTGEFKSDKTISDYLSQIPNAKKYKASALSTRENGALKVFVDDNKPFEVLVRTLTGNTITIKVKCATTDGRLKEMIQDREGIPPDQQRLICYGWQLEDARTMLDYGVESGAVISLVIRLRGC